MRYKLTKEAANDLELIWLYTLETWSLDQADRYFNLIMSEIEFLTENPAYGKDYSHVRKAYLRSRVKSHFIFYQINEAQNEVEIIRILHQRMDIGLRLDE
jgi:toxin ParE1/3/4